MKINIKRERYIVVDTETNEIFTGFHKYFRFVPVTELKDRPLKTYTTVNKAKLSVERALYDEDVKQAFKTGKYKVVKVVESLVQID